jgi:hypothetical protein
MYSAPGILGVPSAQDIHMLVILLIQFLDDDGGEEFVTETTSACPVVAESMALGVQRAVQLTSLKMDSDGSKLISYGVCGVILQDMVCRFMEDEDMHTVAARLGYAPAGEDAPEEVMLLPGDDTTPDKQIPVVPMERYYRIVE